MTRRGELRALPRGLRQLVESVPKLLNGSATAVLQHECEPTRRAQTRNSGRTEREGNGLGDFLAHFPVETLHQPVGGEFRGHALFPWLQLKEEESGVRSRGVGQQAESGNAAKTLDSVRVRKHVINLAHYCIRPLQGGRIRQLYLNERITLVFFRDKAGWKTFSHSPGDDRDSYEQKQ